LSRTALLAGAALSLAASGALAEDALLDLSYKTRFVGEDRHLRDDSVFGPGLPLTSFGRDRARLEGEARGKAGPISLLVTARQSAREGERAEGELVANEAYSNFGAGANRYTAGKKILSGDVGFGFRPIDVLQREQRLQALPPALEGIPHLAWEHYSADSAWTLVWANPTHERRDEPRDDGSFALRHYSRWDKTDLHGVARISSRYKLETGAATSTVAHESLELHSSFLVQRRDERRAPLAEPAATADLLAPDRALRTVTLDNPRKLLLGGTWTVESGWSLLAEAWYDGTAPTAEDWRTLAQQTERRRALIGTPGVPDAAVNGSIAASTRLFEAQNLTRRSALGRLAWTDPAAGGWSASLDWLHSLEDGGWAATAAMGWEADRLRLDAGLRRYGGKPDSAYRLLPERGLLFFGVSLAF